MVTGLRHPPFARTFNKVQVALAIIATALVVGIGGFLLDWLLLGDRRDFLYSDALAGSVAGLLTLIALTYYNKSQRSMIARLRVISEVNHHVRNALSAVLYSVELSENEELIRVTSSAVERIDWTLREILPQQTVTEMKPDENDRGWRQVS